MMPAMPRRNLLVLTLALLAVIGLPACGGGTGSGGGENRTVLVDYNHDEMASNFLAYYPRSVSVHPGDTVTFKQAWTGEPHSVTMGTLVDGLMRDVLPIIEKYPEVESAEQLREQDPAAYEVYERVCLGGGTIEPSENALCPAVPDMFDWSKGYYAAQNGAQPCYLEKGAPPQDPEKACPKREQPAFTGKQTYYNSGYIHYEGEQSNTFKLPLADDIEPGDYQYYCNLHGPGMSGVVKVEPKSKDIPSQNAVDRQARTEITRDAEPLLEAFAEAKAGKAEIGGKPFKGNLAGYGVDSEDVHGFISEFIPDPIRTRVNEKVSWYVSGHTVSFHVPRYFPQLTVAKDGKVTVNPRAVNPVNSPAAEPPEDEGGERFEGGPPEPVEVDAGTWDGRTFISSGVPDSDIIWSLTFTRPGKYKYACLIHPRMVGEVVVSG